MANVVDRTNGAASWVQIAGDKYMACGTDARGKRFRIVNSNWRHIEGINMYNGRKYLVRKGKRYLLSTTTN